MEPRRRALPGLGSKPNQRFRGVATRYDRLAENFLSALALAMLPASGYDWVRSLKPRLQTAGGGCDE